MSQIKRRWSHAERLMVVDMAKAGRPYTAIAKAVDTSVGTLKRHFKSELAGKIRKPGNDPADWTDQERTAILAMASYGIPHQEIAAAFDIGLSTLKEHFGNELSIARTRIDANVTRALIRNALGGADNPGNVAAQIFYLKTQRGWSEKVTVAHEGRIDSNVPTDVDIEAVIETLSPIGRQALRTLLSEAPPETQGDDPPEGETVH